MSSQKQRLPTVKSVLDGRRSACEAYTETLKYKESSIRSIYYTDTTRALMALRKLCKDEIRENKSQ